jgi:hypothetical protein
MKKKVTGFWGYVFILMIVALALILGYHFGARKPERSSYTGFRKPIPQKPKQVQRTPVKAKESPSTEKKEQLLPPPEVSKKDECIELEKEFNDFFSYLDTRDYIRHLQLGMGSYEYFKLILSKLTSNPPVPAGEGVESKLMIRNIYYFYRVLSKTDIRLLKEILVNESEGIEIKLAMLYRWLTSEERCGDPEDIKPSFDVLYRFAGFFMNTVGGRAYLYRRSPKLRVIVSYYCALIINRADRIGKNTYGIDLFPMLSHLYQEMDSRDDLQFKEEYLTNLALIQNYYLRGRS